MAVASQFPTTTKTPVTGITINLGSGGSTAQAQKKTLMVGVGLAAGTKSAGDIDEVTSGAQADTFYGAGSSLARMCRRAIDMQKGARIYGGFVADAAGTAAQATITWGAGPSTAAATYEITLNGWTVTCAIPSGTATAAASTLLIAAIQAHDMYDQMPYTVATGGAGITTLTAKEANVETDWVMNNIWHDDSNLSVLTATLSLTATAGLGALDISTVLAAAATERYNYIVINTSDATNIGRLETHLDTYAAPLQAKRGEGIAASVDTPGNQLTLATAVNAHRVQILGCELFQEQNYEIAAAWAAHRQYREASQVNVPYKRYPLKGIRVPHLDTSYMTQGEIESALNGGITPIGVINSEARVIRSITSRHQTSGGAPDFTCLDTLNVTTSDACGDEVETWVETNYIIEEGIAWKIMDDPTDGSRVPSFVLTPQIAIRDMWSLMDSWYGKLWIVNPESPVDYKAQVAATRIADRMNVTMPDPIMGGAMIFDYTLNQTTG
jgi:phage tail sheath gpL-like